MLRLLILLFSSGFILPAYAFDQAKLMNSYFSVVMVRGYNPDGGMSYGSGVIVAPNRILTDCHIFRQSNRPWISHGEDTYIITAIQADRYHDLCLAQTENLPFKPVTIGSGNALRKNQEVLAIGHSSGVPAPLTAIGVLKSLYPFNNANVIRTTARFTLGASGSGLFDEEGRLIGINTFKTPGRVAYYYALPVEWLASLEKQPVETMFPITGKTFWEEDDDKKPFFMQMAIPEIQEDWPKLLAVAERWSEAEPGNTEAWYELGLAHEKLGKLNEAESAYRKSTALNGSNTDALFRLGIIAAQRGNQDEVRAINLALLNIDKTIAREFSEAVGCKADC